MSARTKKLVADAPKSEEEMKAMVKATVEAQLSMEKHIADRDEATLKAAEPFAQTISDLENTIVKNVALLEIWSIGNRKEKFGELKSLAVDQHRMGWRLGNWKTKLVKGVKSFAVVLENLRFMKRAGKRFIRVVEEVDKETMIRFRHRKKLLARAGVEVVQDEVFYFEPGREGQKPATITAES